MIRYASYSYAAVYSYSFTYKQQTIKLSLCWSTDRQELHADLHRTTTVNILRFLILDVVL